MPALDLKNYKIVDGLPEGMLGVDAQVKVLQLRRAHAQQVNKII